MPFERSECPLDSLCHCLHDLQTAYQGHHCEGGNMQGSSDSGGEAGVGGALSSGDQAW